MAASRSLRNSVRSSRRRDGGCVGDQDLHLGNVESPRNEMGALELCSHRAAVTKDDRQQFAQSASARPSLRPPTAAAWRCHARSRIFALLALRRRPQKMLTGISRALRQYVATVPRPPSVGPDWTAASRLRSSCRAKTGKRSASSGIDHYCGGHRMLGSAYRASRHRSPTVAASHSKPAHRR